jgi:hypothetical protein
MEFHGRAPLERQQTYSNGFIHLSRAPGLLPACPSGWCREAARKRRQKRKTGLATGLWKSTSDGEVPGADHRGGGHESACSSSSSRAISALTLASLSVTPLVS